MVRNNGKPALPLKLTFRAGGFPKPGLITQLDLPDDFFRIQLICTILETCVEYFEKGTGKKKMDFFLNFFQVRAIVPDFED